MGKGRSVPPVYAGRQLSDGRWEVVAPDDDPYRPSWRRWMVISEQKAGSRRHAAHRQCVTVAEAHKRPRR